MDQTLVDNIRKTEEALNNAIKKILPPSSQKEEAQEPPVPLGCKYNRARSYITQGGKFKDIKFYIEDHSLKKHLHAILDSDGTLQTWYYFDPLMTENELAQTIGSIQNLKDNRTLITNL